MFRVKTKESNVCECLWLSELIAEHPTHENQSEKFELPLTFRGMRCHSSKGWMIIVGKDWNVSLLHPFSTPCVKLPNLKPILKWQSLSHVQVIRKCYVASSPSLKSDHTVMIIYGDLGELAYARAGDNIWNPINGWRGCFLDITCYEGQFYAINKCGMIMACNVKDDNNAPNIAQVVAQMPHEYFSKNFEQLCILESAGALLVVSRKRVQCSCKNLRFYVFKVDLITNTWTEIKNLDGRAIFLDHNSSFVIETSNVSHYYKPNSIYFTTNSRLESYSSLCNGGKHNMGIYNLKDGSIIFPHHRGKSFSNLTSPIWLEK